MPTVTPQKTFISSLFTVMAGAFFTMLNLMSAVDVSEFLLVMVIVSVHESSIVSHDLISLHSKVSETLHDSKFSSFHDAMESCHASR
jgi:hypothetical protein